MVRRGRLKYICAHGHGRELFDLAADADEQNNLAGQPDCAAEEAELHAAVLATFDPDAIAEDMLRSRRERRLMHEAMQRGEPTRWDYRP